MMNRALRGLKSFCKQCRRILTIATKPNKSDYLGLAKIVAIGVAILGIIGFILYIFFSSVLFPAA